MNARKIFQRGILAAGISYPDLGFEGIKAVVEPIIEEANTRAAAGNLSVRGARRLVDQARIALSNAHREHIRPRLDRRCIDCAFRPDSPENNERPEQMAAIVAALDAFIAGAGPCVPFYCHAGMPLQVEPSLERGRYVPELDERGQPVGAPLCAGWLEEMDRRRAAHESKGAAS